VVGCGKGQLRGLVLTRGEAVAVDGGVPVVAGVGVAVLVAGVGSLVGAELSPGAGVVGVADGRPAAVRDEPSSLTT
jgi:hypothetical protein